MIAAVPAVIFPALESCFWITASDSMDTKHLLFLCTGNYYRSRYAELLFNNRAAGLALPWHADSRGLHLASGHGNVGPISPYAAYRLTQRGIDFTVSERYPMQAADADFERADLVIALKEAEHRPMMQTYFPRWGDTVEYWRVDDIDVATPDQALGLIEANVESLLQRLGR
jgi:protein-tyrosine phosphatase